MAGGTGGEGWNVAGRPLIPAMAMTFADAFLRAPGRCRFPAPYRPGSVLPTPAGGASSSSSSCRRRHRRGGGKIIPERRIGRAKRAAGEGLIGAIAVILAAGGKERTDITRVRRFRKPTSPATWTTIATILRLLLPAVHQRKMNTRWGRTGRRLLTSPSTPPAAEEATAAAIQKMIFLAGIEIEVEIGQIQVVVLPLRLAGVTIALQRNRAALRPTLAELLPLRATALTSTWQVPL